MNNSYVPYIKSFTKKTQNEKHINNKPIFVKNITPPYTNNHTQPD